MSIYCRTVIQNTIWLSIWAAGSNAQDVSPTADLQDRKTTNQDSAVSNRMDNTARNSKVEHRVPAGPSKEAFEPFKRLAVASESGDYIKVESSGLPEHRMMVGIKAWQQQVPLPQNYTEDNAWQIPRYPKKADTPISVLKKPLRGAIALAVNGVPIFCALNNRGDDTFLAGELDQWGGHCGRGDDYHYHIAPVHLEKDVGAGNPIAFALDGYPLLGFLEPDGSAPVELDRFNGHEDDYGNYHYHATKDFPYINGGLRGVVRRQGDQIRQPQASPIRPAQQPLRGAFISGFHREGNSFQVEYEVSGKKGKIDYAILSGEEFEFNYKTPDGKNTKVVYQRGAAGPSGLKSLIWIIPCSLGVSIPLFLLLGWVRKKR